MPPGTDHAAHAAARAALRPQGCGRHALGHRQDRERPGLFGVRVEAAFPIRRGGREGRLRLRPRKDQR
eukprot:4760488-Pyramimonas_sp.AAC.1